MPAPLRALRWILYGLLLAATWLTLLGVPELARAVGEGRWPRAALAVPPAVLALFIAGYAVYRFALVRAGRYPAGKALVHVGLMLVVLGVIAGMVRDRAATQRTLSADGPDLSAPLRAHDPTVRALAAELVRHRPREAAARYVPDLVVLVEDPAPEVRRQAHASLVELAGTDVGGEGPGAAARWREHWASPSSRR
jgi:hypothetical protein